MSYRRFSSSKTINSWLNQRKVVMFSALGFHFFYKKTKGDLYTYKPSTDTWIPCVVNFFENFPDDYINSNYYTCTLKDTKWRKI